MCETTQSVVIFYTVDTVNWGFLELELIVFVCVKKKKNKKK